jgi:hypothetical protein
VPTLGNLGTPQAGNTPTGSPKAGQRHHSHNPFQRCVVCEGWRGREPVRVAGCRLA